MAEYVGREWSKKELLSYIGDPHQLAGAQISTLNDGKAEGVKVININTGSGLNFSVLPGRGMDISHAFFKGKSLSFLSGTGITSPAYYEESALKWLRSFFGGLLTTCGVSYSGAPSVDQGEPLGLHGRISNTAAEDICIKQGWDGDEYKISVSGMMREASAMGENITLTRSIETKLRQKGFRLHDVIENNGFEPQPLMMLYHFNFGFPLLSPNAKITGPVLTCEPRDEEAAENRGLEECFTFPPPQAGYQEKVFFHNLAADTENKTFMALLNRDIGDGTPLGIVIRFDKRELPEFTEWKMPRQGFYVLGLEPGTAVPLGRAAVRKKGDLLFLQPQKRYTISIDFEVIESIPEMAAIESEARKLINGYDR